MSTEDLRARLNEIVLPELGRTLGELGAVREIASGERARVSLRLPVRAPAFHERVKEAVRAAAGADVEIETSCRVTTREIAEDDPCSGVSNILLVMSGKGGVGKSSVAANLAMALRRQGAEVGLLDADFYGPSVPTMFGVRGRPGTRDGKKVLPLERFGIKLASVGFLLEHDRQAVIWRGPMIQNRLLEFLAFYDWGDLDYLVLDLPPGTGDIAITLAQKIRTTGAVVVTTPQEIALQDVYKSVAMAKSVGIELLGVVENESGFVCDACGKRHDLFGTGGGGRVAEFADAPLLAQIPLDPAIREWGDAGTPVVQAAPDRPASRELQLLAERVELRAARQNLSRAPAFVIDRSGGQQKRLPLVR